MPDKPTLHDVSARALRAAELVAPLVFRENMTVFERRDLHFAERHLTAALDAIRAVRSEQLAAE